MLPMAMVFFCRRCGKLSISGFVDDVILPRNGQERAMRKRRILRVIRQVVARFDTAVCA